MKLDSVIFETPLDKLTAIPLPTMNGGVTHHVTLVPFEEAIPALQKALALLKGEHPEWEMWHHLLAIRIFSLTKRTLAALESPVDEAMKRMVWDAFIAGWMGKRLQLASMEKRADRRHLKKKNYRKAKPNTLREEWDNKFPEWNDRSRWNEHRSKLLKITMAFFPDLTREQASKRVSTLKKFTR